MKVLSLFDGISCARVALERSGIPVEAYYASEIDKYAIQIAQKNYPDTVQLGSVVGLVPPKDIDLLVGGSPCQDLSIAKKDRKGLDGSRSGLFWEYVRILNEVKPKYFILENVASMPKEAKAIITEAVGVEPIMIDAALVSAQRRKRLFWTNIPNITQPEDRGILLKDILEDIPQSDIPLKEKSKTIRSGGRGSGDGDKHEWDSIYQYRRTYWRKTKGGKVPTLTANMGTGGHNVPYVKLSDGSLRVPEATKKGFAIAQVGDSVDTSFPNSKTRRGGVGNKAKNIMTSQSIGVYDGNAIRKLSVVECERLQCLPDNWTAGVSNTQRYKMLGNAFCVEVVAHILKHLK